MNAENQKCVMVVEECLPTGAIANITAILGVTLGMRLPNVVGRDVTDRDGVCHAGIIRFPIPVLKSSADRLRELRGRLYHARYRELTVIDFSDLAQRCRTYEEYIEKMSVQPEQALVYIGLALCGDASKINSLTGNLPLLR